MPRHKSHFPPPRLRCPVCGANAQHLFYHSTYNTRDGPRSLFKCKLCGRCLSERRGTALFNLKTTEREVTSCLDSMTRGDTQTSISQARRHNRDTLRRWRRRATFNARAVDAELLVDLCVKDLELDEQWSFAGKKKAPFEESNFRGEAWWHKSFARESRLLVEQFVSPRTAEAAGRLVEDSFERMRLHCLPRVSSDGYDEYRKPLSEQVREVKLHQLKLALKKQTRSGPPRKERLILDPRLVYGQVIKHEEGQSVRIEKKLMLGAVGEDLRWCSTALLERQNGTARSRNRYLTRKTYEFAKLVEYMDDQCILDKVFYNFCRRHRGLKGQTPAQRHGVSDHVWSIAEVLRYRPADP